MQGLVPTTYYTLSFDKDGLSVNLNEQQAIIDRLTSQDPANPSITDLWILAYGWNNDIQDGTHAYKDIWIPRLQDAMQLVNLPSGYSPMYVGIFWPSKAWADYTQQPTVQETHILTGQKTLRSLPPELLTKVFDEPISPLPVEPTMNPQPPVDPEQQQSFVEAYRAAMDSTFGTPGFVPNDQYQQDFAQVYTYLQTPQPNDDDIKNLVTILKRYQQVDPHSEVIEAKNVTTSDVDQIVNWLRRQYSLGANPSTLSSEKVDLLRTTLGGIPPENNLLDPLGEGLLNFFRLFTFWTMKARATIVGKNGLYPFLQSIKHVINRQSLSTRIHLLGHSFGGKLISSAVYCATQDNNLPEDITLPFVDTLVLLMGAFSQYSFTPDIPEESNASGTYTPVVLKSAVANPLLAIYTQYDLANKVFYPLGMMPSFLPINEIRPLPGLGPSLAESTAVSAHGESPTLHAAIPLVTAASNVATFQPSNEKFGSVGANGMQGLTQDRFAFMLMPSKNTDPANQFVWPDLTGKYCVNVDGQYFLNQSGFPTGAHNDFDHVEIFQLALSLSLRG